VGIGTKIRQIRDLKGLNQENMANELGISLTGYGKIERNEVSVNYDRLLQISSILGVKVESIIGFDKNVALNNFNNTVEKQIGTYNLPIELKQLYEDKIKLLEEKVKLLEEKIKRLQEKTIQL
jgi:transcriptional regulator with XRE-family HTH domain